MSWAQLIPPATTLSRNSKALFHRTRFITFHLQRKTYGNLFGGSGCGCGEYSWKDERMDDGKSAQVVLNPRL
jgi:hypothetical protein